MNRQTCIATSVYVRPCVVPRCRMNDCFMSPVSSPPKTIVVPDSAERPGAFALGWNSAIRNGLVIIPTRPDDAKRPLLKNWNRLIRPPRESTCAKWTVRWPDANLACIPGASNAVVVDWDDKATAQRAEEIFGPAAVIIETRRGFQYWYRHQGGIPSRDLRAIGLEAEIKSQRVIVVLPGSIHPVSRQPYRFARGNWDDFSRLTEFNVSGLENLTSRETVSPTDLTEPTIRNLSGTRNRSTFTHLCGLGASGAVGTLDELRTLALTYNARANDPPLERGEIEKICKSVWKYISNGTCRAPKRSPHPMLTQKALETLRSLRHEYTDALVLFLELKMRWGHIGALGEPFPISANGMAKAEVIPGWRDKRRYLRARNALIQLGLIRQFSRARFGKTAALFTFAEGTL